MEEKWKKEPNEYRFSVDGFNLVAKRLSSTKSWTGYIILGSSHPWFGAPAEEIRVPVHNGVTYADFCPFSPDPRNDQWWVGFDCSGRTDLMPFDWEAEGKKYPNLFKHLTYRDLDFVKEELRKLAKYARIAVENQR